ncbi:hypothetical protein E2C01_066947 [Portunus trituberculatus]|uniref:Uncharacterized protein n=1 Tax=Portunus trituberculatus TaxID=210409 RepID=A0A5B7HSC5_PORTR|nr:hypothetical protein [Portunus trituberculatus]
MRSGTLGSFCGEGREVITDATTTTTITSTTTTTTTTSMIDFFLSFTKP